MNGGSMNGRHFRSTGTLSPTRQVREAQSRGFSYSSKQQRQQQRQQQRLALNSVGKKKIHGGTNGRRYSHHQQHIPNYVYFVGGIPFVGGIYLYFRFQDFVPLTGRRRWLATQPETERIFGDEVSRGESGRGESGREESSRFGSYAVRRIISCRVQKDKKETS